jgi:hypothetical protein
MQIDAGLSLLMSLERKTKVVYCILSEPRPLHPGKGGRGEIKGETVYAPKLNWVIGSWPLVVP